MSIERCQSLREHVDRAMLFGVCGCEAPPPDLCPSCGRTQANVNRPGPLQTPCVGCGWYGALMPSDG